MKGWANWLAPALVPCVPVLRQLAHNADQADFAAAAPSLGLLLGGTGLLLLLLRAACGDWPKAALAACVCWILFFLDGLAFEHLWDGDSLETIPRLNLALMIAEAAVAILVIVLLRRLERPLDAVVRWTALTAGFLVVSALGSYLWREPNAVVTPDPPATPARSAAPAASASDASRPDVYHIVLDGYARGDVLREVYGFDNGEFLRALEQRGFRVLPDTYSNYSTTYLSLSATLNHRYHPTREGELPRGRRSFYELIQNATVLHRFRSLGYAVHWVGTSWTGTQQSAAADEVHRVWDPVFHSEFAAVLWRKTPLRQFEPTVARSHLFAFSAIERIAERREATYTFVHVLAPHNPYVFDAEGNVIAHVPQTLQFNRRIFTPNLRWSNQDAYIAQLRFINKRVLAAIDHALGQPGPRPVIILQSDHGSAFRVGRTPNDVDVARERHGVLNAILAPPEWQRAFPEQGTLINTYPLLFTHGFRVPTPVQEDRVYYSWYGAAFRPKDLSGAFGFAVASP